MDEIETIKYRGFEINIYQDESLEDPREWDNLGTMVCFHNKYNLGDKHNFNSLEDMWISLAEDVDFILEETGEKIREKAEEIVNKHYIVLPLYLFDHSGITMSTRPFSCHWDSRQVGIIYVSKEEAKKETAIDILTGEVETYDKFISGEVYRYNIEPIHFWNKCDCADSCWGFYDYKQMVSEAKLVIDSSIKEYKKEMVKQHKERKETTLFLRTCWAD